MANYLGNCEQCGEQKPCMCGELCAGLTTFQGDFNPLEMVIGNYVYLRQRDSQITLDRTMAASLAHHLIRALSLDHLRQPETGEPPANCSTDSAVPSFHCYGCGEPFPASCACKRPDISWNELRRALLPTEAR